MLTLGITGGIACGKTTVAEWLRDAGAPVINADAISRSLTGPGGDALSAIRAAFGKEVFTKDGSLNRSALGNIVFASSEQRIRLEAILHPKIREEIEKAVEACRKQGAKIVVLEIPLLYEAGMEDLANQVICVSARRETQIARLKTRDGLSRIQAQQRIRSQWPLAQKEALAQYTIYTDRPGEDAYAKTMEIYHRLLKGVHDDSTSLEIPE